MRIVHVVPGSGGAFYCQNCLRDGALVKALRAAGLDVVMAPMYLPLLVDDPALQGDVPVFYGAVGVFLGQALAPFRRAPRWLRRLLNAPPLLRWAARHAEATRARGLEALTLSVLRGEDGRQTEELRGLVEWLRGEARPDVVHLSNALLLGLAGPIRSALGVPVVCSLQDEDVWVDAMEPGQAATIWETMAARAADVAAFAAVSQTYAERMRPRLRLSAERVHVVYPGIDLAGYGAAPQPPQDPTLGFLSRLAESLGLGILAEAFLILKRDPSLRRLRLRATGGGTGDDRRFLRRLRRRLAEADVGSDAEFLPDFGIEQRIEFLRSLTVLSVPVPQGEAFGAFQIEAMACGVPVVQPRVGAFPEIVAATGGGVLYAPNEPAVLAEALRPLLLDPVRARSLGRHGLEAAHARFGIDRMAADMLRVYQSVAPL